MDKTIEQRIEALTGQVDDIQTLVTGLKDITLILIRDQELMKKSIAEQEKQTRLMELRLTEQETQQAENKKMFMEMYKWMKDHNH